MINMSTLEAARNVGGIKNYVFTSSVCVYPMYKLSTVRVRPLCDDDVHPADPQGLYGWEKLWTEQLVGAYQKQYGLNTHIVRLQNTYGPRCEWRDAKSCPEGQRTKAPAAIARKVAIAKLTDNPEIEIWGDGLATRAFTYSLDCVRGIYTVGKSDCHDPITVGSDTVINVNTLVDLLARHAGIRVTKKYVEGPQGVRGRNFDHSRVMALGWRPEVALNRGLYLLYRWIESQVRKSV
jgi:nucleoside-diphosphate-sugar epimerase